MSAISKAIDIVWCMAVNEIHADYIGKGVWHPLRLQVMADQLRQRRAEMFGIFLCARGEEKTLADQCKNLIQDASLEAAQMAK